MPAVAGGRETIECVLGRGTTTTPLTFTIIWPTHIHIHISLLMSGQGQGRGQTAHHAHPDPLLEQGQAPVDRLFTVDSRPGRVLDRAFVSVFICRAAGCRTAGCGSVLVRTAVPWADVTGADGRGGGSHADDSEPSLKLTVTHGCIVRVVTLADALVVVAVVGVGGGHVVALMDAHIDGALVVVVVVVVGCLCGKEVDRGGVGRPVGGGCTMHVTREKERGDKRGGRGVVNMSARVMVW